MIKGFISSRVIRGSALVEISGDSDDSRSCGDRRRKVYYLIHVAPIFTSLCLRCFNPAVTTIATIAGLTLLLLLLYCCCYTTVASDKLHQVSYIPGVADLTNQLLRLINILWLPLCRINKFGFYFLRRLLRSPILVGHHRFNR